MRSNFSTTSAAGTGSAKSPRTTVVESDSVRPSLNTTSTTAVG